MGPKNRVSFNAQSRKSATEDEEKRGTSTIGRNGKIGCSHFENKKKVT